MKRFSRDLYDRYDLQAKLAGLQYLMEMEATQITTPINRYGVDLEYLMGDRAGMLECEVKAVWAGGGFPYPTVNVLGRKTKFFKEGAELLLMSADLATGLSIPAEIVLDSPMEEVRNKYVNSGEWFYKVDVNRATGIYLNPSERPGGLECPACAAPLALALTNRAYSCMGCGHERYKF
jgi:hypothetical protein